MDTYEDSIEQAYEDNVIEPFLKGEEEKNYETLQANAD